MVLGCELLESAPLVPELLPELPLVLLLPPMPPGVSAAPVALLPPLKPKYEKTLWRQLG